jgi:glycosyltransferase involved in cell wall biosynthesis
MIGGSVLKRKLSFLFRQFFNPIILFFYLRNEKSSLVVFNDFEQSTAPFWVPLFKLFLRKHKYTVYLHDPNRDAYPPNYSYSKFSMRILMCMMDIACFHERLPNKSYYRNLKAKFLSVPHGIYPGIDMDYEFYQELKKMKGQNKLVSMLGNIRKEKNYETSIRSLVQCPNIVLLIAGRAASSSVDINEFKNLAIKKGVNDRIIWITRFISDEEMSSCIQASDLILLNYSSDFASQSAILNDLADYKKDVLVSNTESALTETVIKYDIAKVIEADNQKKLEEAFNELQNNEIRKSNWHEYSQYASWKENTNMVLNTYTHLINERL